MIKVNNYSLGEIFFLIRNNVFEMSLLEFENLINHNNAENFSYSKWQRLEKNEFGTSFKDKPLRAIEHWSKTIINALENTKLINDRFISPINYNKRLYFEILDLLKKSQYLKVSYSYNFETINVSNINDIMRFITCVFIIFSGNHGKYFAGNDSNPTTLTTGCKIPSINKVGTRTIDPNYPNVVISNFDFRFVLPNTKGMPIDAAHTLEHFFADYIRENTGELIDVSIMGCLTGFLMYFTGDKDVSWVEKIFIESLQCFLKSTTIPKATPDVCWNAQNHDLDGAKIWANRFLEGIDCEEL